MRSSPHGSRVFEFMRFMAIRFVSDERRKAIKKQLAWWRAIPRKLLGVEAELKAQQDAIDRLKSKITMLEGKLNLTLYGLPDPGELKASLLSDSVLESLRPTLLDRSRAQAMGPSGEELLSAGLAKLEPKRALLFRANVSVAQIVGGIRSIQEATLIESDEAALAAFDPKRSGVALRRLHTTPVNGLVAATGTAWDLIGFPSGLVQLAPMDQARWIAQAVQALSPGGTLVLGLPDLRRPEVLSDTLWSDPQVLRPHSLSAIRAMLERAGAQVTETALPSSRSVLLTARRPAVT